VLGRAGTGGAAAEFVAANLAELATLDPCEAPGANDEAGFGALSVEDPSRDGDRGTSTGDRRVGAGMEPNLPQDLGEPLSKKGRAESVLGLPPLESEVGGIAAG
jgi:hypothetical protein